MNNILSLILHNPMLTWLALGLVFLLVDLVLIPSRGLRQAALGAFTLGGVMYFGLFLNETLLVQIIFFVILTFGWLAILNNPFRFSRKKPQLNTIIGSTGTVEGDGLHRGKTGKVRWNGALMKARMLDDSSLDKIPHGEKVFIVASKGKMLFVKPAWVGMPSEEELLEYRKLINGE